jgi:hypothetical protein
MATRRQNEQEYKQWENLSDGGRRYWRERAGRVHGFQRIVKIVDANENTVFVIQEVYNEDGELVERHQKYPVDTGHEKLNDADEEIPQ